MSKSIRFDQNVSMEMRAGALLMGEEADCYDTVEWVASQSLRDSNVGMAGAPVIPE